MGGRISVFSRPPLPMVGPKTVPYKNHESSRLIWEAARTPDPLSGVGFYGRMDNRFQSLLRAQHAVPLPPLIETRRGAACCLHRT